MKRLLAIALTAAAMVVTLATPVSARPPVNEPLAHDDNILTPLSEKQAELRQTAIEMVLRGEAQPRGRNDVVQVSGNNNPRDRIRDQYVELAFEGEDQILTLLGEFGAGVATHHGGHPGPAGPLHNEIPEPDRSVDNTTIWEPDFSQSYYDSLLYDKNRVPSMANWYLEQSSGQYSVDGFVGDWVQVPNNAASYGSNYCGGIVCADTWRFVNDQADVWWAELVAEQGSVAAANAFIASFDVWDRYDYNGNGDFDEPDGYIDHFQSVHAGEGEETGGGAQGTDAIWSHRWYAYFPGSPAGPDGSGPHGLQGVRIGDSDYWIGDYTIEPENGGVGVFAHEFAHDLNLPDLYDTSGNVGGAENSTAWWTVMSQGSYGTISDDLGSYPVHFGAWEKLQLGFLENYTWVEAGERGTFQLGPAEYNTNKPQAMFIVLPDVEVTHELGAPFEGDNYYYSGSEDNLDTTMTRSVALPAGTPSLTAKVRYNIEEDFDFAYVSVNGTLIPTNLSNSSVSPNGIDGVAADWVDLTADLTDFAGQTVDIGFGYFTDGGVEGQVATQPAGFAVDNIQITGQELDGAETDAGWTFDTNIEGVGFHVTTGTETSTHFNAYVLENRQYTGYDEALRKGPYNFGFPDRPNFVEHFPYQDGLLISYWNEAFGDNNVGDHPGQGLILPVDSHPQIETWDDGSQMRPRIQSYDSTFTPLHELTNRIRLHNPADGEGDSIGPKIGNPLFSDSLRNSDGTSLYWRPGHPSDAPGNGQYQAEWNSVDVPDTGTEVLVLSMSRSGNMVIRVF